MLGKAGNRFRKGEWSLWSMRWPSVTTMRKQMLKLMERCGQNSVWLMLSDKKFSTIAAFIFHFKAKSGFKASVAEMWQLSEAESLLWNSFWINYNEKVFSGLSWHTLTRIVSAEVTWRTIFHTYKKLVEWSRSRVMLEQSALAISSLYFITWFFWTFLLHLLMKQELLM